MDEHTIINNDDLDNGEFNGGRFLEDRRSDLRASIEYFSNKNKAERERWVCINFMENLGINFDETEVISPDDDPPDVIFREARFEIKEILDPGRRRHAEFKEELDRALHATDPKDHLRPYTPKDMTPLQVGDLILSEMEGLKNYAPSARRNLDLLFYVDLIEHLLKDGPMLADLTFSAFEWRSIAALFGWGSFVFYAADDAPAILREHAGNLIRRKFA
jgi:hypothetical protein